MSQIERNSLVTIFYRLGLPNGDVLEDNFDDEPMTVQLGCGEMAEGLELALIGLREGEEETIDIRPDLAFGYIDETLFRSIPRIEFDPDLELEPGLIIEFATEEGETLPGTILEQSEPDLYATERELRGIAEKHEIDVEIVPILGSVLNQSWMEQLLRSFHVRTVYHAAAYKHVPLVEYNMAAGIHNNIFGTKSEESNYKKQTTNKTI